MAGYNLIRIKTSSLHPSTASFSMKNDFYPSPSVLKHLLAGFAQLEVKGAIMLTAAGGFMIPYNVSDLCFCFILTFK